MLIEKPIVNTLEHEAFLMLIDLLWGKATRFSLANFDVEEDIAIRESATSVEGNQMYFSLNPQTRAYFSNLTGFLDLSECGWCDPTFYADDKILLMTTTHESAVELDDRLYEDLIEACHSAAWSERSGVVSLLKFDRIEKEDLAGAMFSWKRNEDNCSVCVLIRKGEAQYEIDYRFPVEFTTVIPEGKEVVVQEIEFGSQGGLSMGGKNVAAFSVTIVTDPPRIMRYTEGKTVEETSFDIVALSVHVQ